MARTGYVYILASRKQSTLDAGVTNDLMRRVEEYLEGSGRHFSFQG